MALYVVGVGAVSAVGVGCYGVFCFAEAGCCKIGGLVLILGYD